MMDPVGSVIEANKAQWNKIGDCGPAADTASGRAGLHLQPAREEIARKLIGNHVKVLKDCTNSAPLTQLELSARRGRVRSTPTRCCWPRSTGCWAALRTSARR